MKKCIAIVLSLSITFGYCTSTVFGDEPPKKQNKNIDILPKPDIELACSILGSLGFIGFLKYLYKTTSLEASFGINMVAIANGKPSLMGLFTALVCLFSRWWRSTRRRY